jgi:hypothetical protein
MPGIHTIAQTSTVSNPNNGHDNNPYSKFGVGELMNGNNVALRGMGDITSAYEDPFTVNANNPASYSFLRRTTFEAGMMARTRSITNGEQHYTSGTASIAYLNIGFPIGTSAGLCFGFKPYSQTYYNLVDTISATTTPASPVGTMVKVYNGEGSLTLPYIGASYKYRGLSFGANLGYLFGTIRNTTAAVPDYTQPANVGVYISEFTKYTQVGGLYWKGGLLYAHTFDSSYTFRIGGTFALNQDLTERLNDYWISNYTLSDTAIHDTVYNPGEQKGKLRLPMSYSIGVLLGKTDKWSIGVDYAASQWSNFRSYPDTAMQVGVGNTAYKLSIGGEYTPDINSIRSYFSRVTYRLGAYYGKDYLRINNTDLPFYGLTAGASFPFRRSLSRLHTALDVGRLGTTTNGQMQQTYVRFSVGVSFNDLWFVKRRYD